MRSIILIAGLGLSLVAGCGGGNSCEDVIANASKLYGFGGASYAKVRDAAIQQCKDEKWSDKLRACAVAAKTRAALDDCEKLKTESAAGAADEYAKTSKRSEAELNLDAIKKSLKAYYVEKAEFPKGSVPLTPAASCCEAPAKKCPANVSSWEGVPLWDELDFAVYEAHYFQYSYTSTDGQVAIAEAVADLDCDGVTVTYTLRCEAPQGNVSCTLTKPDRPD